MTDSIINKIKKTYTLAMPTMYDPSSS